MDSIALQFAVVAFCVAQVRHKMATWAVGLLHQLAVGTAGCERTCMQQCWCVLACLENSALDRRSSGGVPARAGGAVCGGAGAVRRGHRAVRGHSPAERGQQPAEVLGQGLPAQRRHLPAVQCALEPHAGHRRSLHGHACTVFVHFLQESLMLASHAVQMLSCVLFKLCIKNVPVCVGCLAGLQAGNACMVVDGGGTTLMLVSTRSCLT